MIINNRRELATTETRRKALEIIEAGIKRVLPDIVLRASVSFESATRTLYVNGNAHPVKGRIFVIGGGKASGLMAVTLEGIIGRENIEAGIVVDKAEASEFNKQKIRLMQAGHPLPDERGVSATRAVLDMKSRYAIGRDDLVICLLSGGGSALMPCPADGLSLQDKQIVTGLLLSCGADIHEINTVRKHLSRTKGGRLARHFSPAAVLSIIISDVTGNDMSVIASGPTYPDPSRYSDAYGILEKYGLLRKIPAPVVSLLERGRRGEVEETPKSLDNVYNYIVGDNRLALEAMAEKAASYGFKPVIVTAEQKGDTEEKARLRANEITAGKYGGYGAVLIGGETTPTLPENPGHGGRNQHYAALTMLLLDKYPGDWLAASIATDGSDYMPDIAGAIVDRSSLAIVKENGMDIAERLRSYDSYTVLKEAGNALVITGNTGTNVGDVILYLLPAAEGRHERLSKNRKRSP